MNYNKFILFGDSITQFSTILDDGYALQPKLQYDYTRKLDVINRGYSGYNSDHGVLILPRLLEQELNAQKDNIKLMTIFLGTNDAFVTEDEINKIQAVPLERYEKNITKLVELAIENNIKPIVISPTLHGAKPALEDLKREGRPSDKYRTTNRRNKEYADAAIKVAKKFNVAYIDLWNAFRSHGGWSEEELFTDEVDLSELLYDGIHFRRAGYEVLYEQITKAIKSNYPELAPQSLPTKLSLWNNINPKDQAGSIFQDKIN